MNFHNQDQKDIFQSILTILLQLEALLSVKLLVDQSLQI